MLARQAVQLPPWMHSTVHSKQVKAFARTSCLGADDHRYADNALRRGRPYVLRVEASLASVDFYIRSSMLRSKHRECLLRSGMMSIQAFQLRHAAPHGLAFHTGPWRKAAAQACFARSRYLDIRILHEPCQPFYPWVARTSNSCTFRCYSTFRCHRAKSSAIRAGQHEGEHRMSRRALQSELLAALLVTVHGLRPDDAMADTQEGTDSAQQELDLTITDKVSWTHFLRQR